MLTPLIVSHIVEHFSGNRLTVDFHTRYKEVSYFDYFIYYKAILFSISAKIMLAHTLKMYYLLTNFNQNYLIRELQGIASGRCIPLLLFHKYPLRRLNTYTQVCCPI